MSNNWNFFDPTHVVFGPGRLDELATMELPGRKALIVTTNGKSVVKNGYLDRVKNLLAKRDVKSVVYSNVSQNPTQGQVMEAAAMVKENQCDFIIALGGGSAIDASKMIAIMAKNPGVLWDYIGGGSGKAKPVENGALPFVAITTTAGTGSEIDPWAVTNNEDTGEKIGWGGDMCFADIAIIDPELMKTVPAVYKAYQGMDTFFHLAECYITTLATPMSDIMALKGIALVAENLPKAVADAEDIDAITQVAFANSLGGYTQFLSGCASQHAMEHAISGKFPKVVHGAALCAMSEAYFTFFMDKPGYAERYVDMARAMGVNVDALSQEDRAASFIKALHNLMAACGVADLKMSDWGIRREDCDMLAETAHYIMPGMFQENDRYHMSVEETADIFRNAYK